MYLFKQRQKFKIEVKLNLMIPLNPPKYPYTTCHMLIIFMSLEKTMKDIYCLYKIKHDD